MKIKTVDHHYFWGNLIRWTAHDADTYDDTAFEGRAAIKGWGDTEAEAITDLMAKLKDYGPATAIEDIRNDLRKVMS